MRLCRHHPRKFCKNPRKVISRKCKKKKEEIGKIMFLHFPQADEGGRIRTKSKNKTSCFPHYVFCADGFGRIFYFPKLWKIERLQKEGRTNLGDNCFSPSISTLDKDMTHYRVWWVGGRQHIGKRLVFLIFCDCLDLPIL